MQRHEAIQVLREICSCIPDASAVDCVSLHSRDEISETVGQDFELHIKTVCTESTLKSIQSIVRSHRLVMDESDGCLVIFSPVNRLAEVTV